METLKSKDKTTPNTHWSILDIQLQPVEPRTLKERIYHSYQPIADRLGVKLSMDVPQESVNILIDEGRMLQVLKNLVDNALR
jgi:signal transduction histidine kinase